jgi:hypothetical protein
MHAFWPLSWHLCCVYCLFRVPHLACAVNLRSPLLTLYALVSQCVYTPPPCHPTPTQMQQVSSASAAVLGFDVCSLPCTDILRPPPSAATVAVKQQVSSASAAVSSFDDVCEAFGDIAKLDNLVARGAAAGPAAAAALLAPPGAPVAFDLSVALR